MKNGFVICLLQHIKIICNLPPTFSCIWDKVSINTIILQGNDQGVQKNYTAVLGQGLIQAQQSAWGSPEYEVICKALFSPLWTPVTTLEFGKGGNHTIHRLPESLTNPPVNRRKMMNIHQF